jgi:hypothetical protein
MYARIVPKLARPGPARGFQEPPGTASMNRTLVLTLAAVILAGTFILVGIHTVALDKGAAAQAAAARLAADRLAAAEPTAPPVAPQLPGSGDQAYQFLNRMMDRYQIGPTPRLVQSYLGGLMGEQDNTSSDIYDDAVVIDAYLSEGRGGRARAEVIGKALLYLQAQQVPHDGRLFNSYAPTPLQAPGSVQVTDPASSTGNMAWAGQALAQLYAATRIKAYLAGAIAVGDWIQAHCRDVRGTGGYTGGYTSSGAEIEWKSTEHNIDVYAFFRLLVRETGNPAWSSRAAWARRFIVSMWDPGAGRFSLGTTNDGVTVNDSSQVEDVNSWSYLALQDPAYEASVDWDVANLGVTADGYGGVSICAEDRTGVWFEGTAHLADALETQDQPGDTAQAASYLADIAYAQVNGPNADGLGIMASSQDALADCGGGYVYASLHTGATAWYILAANGIDPLSGIPVARQAARR